jgi:hypothetical protein
MNYNTKEDIVNGFKNMNKIPVIEIFDEGRQEYICYWIRLSFDEKSFEVNGADNLIILEIDDCFSLDEHLQTLYEMIIESEQLY